MLKEKKRKFRGERVAISVDGRMSYTTLDEVLHEVFREFRTPSGLMLETKYDDITGIKFFEQRHEEKQQLEERIATCEKSLRDFAVVDTSSNTSNEAGKVVEWLKNEFNNDVLLKKDFESFLGQLNDNRIMLTEQEAMQYNSLLLQITRADRSISSVGKYIDEHSYASTSTATYVLLWTITKILLPLNMTLFSLLLVKNL